MLNFAPFASSRAALAAIALACLIPALTGCLKPTGPSVPPAPADGGAPTGSGGAAFVDMASSSGIGDWRWEPLGKRPLTILQTIGNGCGFVDYDGDGNLDIVLVGKTIGLFHGDGKGTFVDVSASTGIGALRGYFLGVASGDYDNDGFVDLYVSGYRDGRLLRNDGGKRFVDVTASTGTRAQPWGTACGFADIDRDGFLDLYVGNYADFGPDTKPQLCKFRTATQGELLSSCGPTRYKAIPGVLYKNTGGKRFVDITKAAGFSTQNGRTLGVAFADLHGDGYPSVALANDEAPGDLFAYRKPLTRENIGEASGVATDSEGKVHGGMGVDWGDYDNDGKLDLFVATFRNEIKNLYKNEGDELFVDRSYASGLGQPTLPYVAFGAKFLDADNDGWLDLMIANGHVQDNINLIEDTTYKQPLLFLQNEKGMFRDAGKSSGIDKLPRIVGRGLAVGDYDNDGLVDCLVVDSEGKPLLLHNETKSAARWIGFVCRDSHGRDAYGAMVTLTLADGSTRVRQCQSAGSYLSASDPRVHFGLGSGGKAAIKSVTVRWPDGKSETWSKIPPSIGRYNVLTPGGSLK